MMEDDMRVSSRMERKTEKVISNGAMATNISEAGGVESNTVLGYG